MVMRSSPVADLWTLTEFTLSANAPQILLLFGLFIRLSTQPCRSPPEYEHAESAYRLSNSAASERAVTRLGIKPSYEFLK
jgi:hypothetical protein